MAMLFDGVNDIIDFGDIAAIDGAANVTYAFWYHPVTFADLQGVFGKGYTHLGLFQYAAADQSLTAQMAAGTAYGTSGASTFPTGEWHHVVLVYDGTQGVANDRLKMYKDGLNTALTYTGTLPTTVTASTETVKAGGDVGLAGYANMKMANLKVWTASLTAGEAFLEAKHWGVQTNHASCIIWAPLDDESATDYSGAGNHGTITEAVTETGGAVIGMSYPDRMILPARNSSGQRAMGGFGLGPERRNRFRRLGPLVPRYNING